MKIIETSGATDQPPIIFMPETALVRPATPFFIPDSDVPWAFIPYVAIEIKRLGKSISAKFAHRYYDGTRLMLKAVTDCGPMSRVNGIDGTLLLSTAVSMGSLDYSLVTIRNSTDNKDACESGVMDYQVDGSMTDRCIETVSRYTTLHTGDLIIFPLTRGFGIPVIADCRIIIEQGGEEVLNHKIK